MGKSSSSGSSSSSTIGRLPLEQHSAPRTDGQHVARLQHGGRRGLEQLGASADAFDEDALGARGTLEIRHGLARRGVGQPVGTDAPFLVRQANVLIRGAAARRHLGRQFLALRLHVDAKQAWRRDRQKPDDESRAHEVADRIGHGNVVLQPRLLGLRQIEPVDGVAGGADHRRFGERPGHQAGRGPGVVAKQLRRHERRHQAGHAEDDRQRDLGQRILFQAAKELRPDLVAGGKQEQREEDRLDRGDRP